MKKLKKIYLILFIALCLAVILIILFKTKDKDSDNRKEPSTEETSEVSSETEMTTVVINTEDAISELKQALEKTDISDMDSKLELLEKSANQGNTDAMFFLGEIYFQGIGVERDYVKAASYFEQASQGGNSKAFSIYAKMLFMGDGVEQNYDESASYFYTLSESDGEACYIYAVMSNLGMGMPRNLERASTYIEKAMALGYEQAFTYKDKIVNAGKMPTDIFDYTPPAKKIITLSYESENTDLEVLIDNYSTKLKQSENYESFYTELEALKQINILGISTLAYFGNGGYLFHMNENDGNSLHDYMADEYYTDTELKAIADNLTAQKKYVESEGSKFVVLLIPNKENVYFENVPSYIERSGTVTKQDKLVEYLKNNTDLDIVYTKETLLDNKDTFQLYYKTDTHTNMVGSLFILSDLFVDLFGDKIDISLDKFDIHMENYLGDLGNMVSATDRYSSDTVYYYPEGSVADDEKIDSSIMLVGDSFSEFLNIEAGYYFTGGVDHRMITKYGYDYETATKAGFSDSTPDYVIWEVVERYTDRLK